MIGLDGYMCLRFILVCLRMASFCTFCGVLVLVPIYADTTDSMTGKGVLYVCA
jgi:hypothetical protein